MKSFIKNTLCVLLLLGSFWAQSQAQEDRYKVIEPAKESMKKLYGNLDWSDFDGKEKLQKPCKADFFQKFKNVRNPFKEITNQDFVGIVLPLASFLDMVEQAVEGDNFPQIEPPKDAFINPETFKRDKMIEKLQAASNAAEFVEFYATNFDQTQETFTETEIKKLKQIHQNYLDIFERGRLLKLSQYQVGDCNYLTNAWAKVTNIQSRQIDWRIHLRVRIYCKCEEGKTPLNLKKFEDFLESEARSSIRDYKIETLRFTNASKPRSTLPDLYCCGSKDPLYEDGDGYEETIPEGAKGGKPKDQDQPDPPENDTPKDKDKDCCFEEQASNSIGFFPVIGLNDNFDSTAIGVGVESLHGFGTSFGNNQWYAGLQGQYLTESRQDGEVTTNAFAAAGIVENRNPILPCTQWVQRVCAQYTTGSVDAFGNKDNFSGLTFGIHTGLNLDVSPSISIAADGTVLTLGSTKFEAANGQEQTQDIGAFNLGNQQVRFGIRFKF